MGKATIEDLKLMLVDAKLALVEERVPRGHCPYAYYDIGLVKPNCNDVDCDECMEDFFNEYKKQIRLNVETL